MCHHVGAVGVLRSLLFRYVAAVHVEDGTARPRVTLQLLRCLVPDSPPRQQTVTQEADPAQHIFTEVKPIL